MDGAPGLTRRRLLGGALSVVAGHTADIVSNADAEVAGANTGVGASVAVNIGLDDTEAYVGRAFVMKRFHARARGRAGKVVKPWSNLTVVVREREETA